MSVARGIQRAKGLARDAILGPSQSFERRHLPILGAYLGYGALGLTAVAEAFVVKARSSFTPVDLAFLGLMLALPWSVKMLLGLVVDSLPLFRKGHRNWLLAGSIVMAAGLLLHAANTSGHILIGSFDLQYAVASSMVLMAVVMQDVVADALSSAVVPRCGADGNSRLQKEVVQEMAMVQIMGRFTFAFGAGVAGAAAGWLASNLAPANVYLLGLVVPCVIAAAAIFGTYPPIERARFDWWMLLGGFLTGGIILLVALAPGSLDQEIVFLVSLAVAGLLLWRVAQELDADARVAALSLAVLIFTLRASPGLGSAYTWFATDTLKFDEAFFHRLAQIGTVSSLLGLWFASRFMSRNNQTRVLLVLILIEPFISLLAIGPIFGLHHWTAANLNVGARELALFDNAMSIRLANLSMVAMLTLTAFFAPSTRPATWFALMASIMNLGLVASSLQTKYLGLLITVDRSDLTRLPEFAMAIVALGAIVPWLVVALVGRRLA